MYKYLISISLIFFCLVHNSTAQSIDFEINIVDDSVDIFPAHFTRGLGNCIMGIVNIDVIYDTINPYYNYFTTIYKLDVEGDTVSKSFAKEDTVCTYDRILTISNGDPGYLLTGNGYQVNSSPLYKFVIFTRLDPEMNVIWEKIYSFNLPYYGGYYSRVLSLKDESFLYCFNPGSFRYTGILHISTNGDSLAYNHFEGDSAGDVWSLTYSPDSLQYWLHTQWAHYWGGEQLSSRLIIDTNLSLIGYDFFPDGLVGPFACKLYPDGSLLAGGWTSIAHISGYYEDYISAYRLDASLNILYSRHCTNPDTISRGAGDDAIDYYYPGIIYLGGPHYLQGITGQYPNWFYICKLNDTLGIEYEKYIGGDDYYWLNSVVATKDGGVFLAGTREEVGGPELHRNGYIIKFDSTGCTTKVPEGSKLMVKEALVYPNPGNNFLNVRTAKRDCLLILYNQFGYIVYEEKINSLISTFNVASLASGSYYYSIIQENNSIDSGMWVKQ